jgi:uncharacterized protein (TIGR03067 family)
MTLGLDGSESRPQDIRISKQLGELMRAVKIVAALACFVAASSSASSADDEVKGDLAKLQGKWEGMFGPQKALKALIEIKGKRIVISSTNAAGQERSIKGEIRINESKSPKEMDFLNRRNPQGREIPDGKGIYQVDDDTLKVCVSRPGEARPTEFKEAEGLILTEYTRVK